MSEPVTDTHELPARGLSAACALIAEARGSPIRSYGSTDLVQPGTGGGGDPSQLSQTRRFQPAALDR